MALLGTLFANRAIARLLCVWAAASLATWASTILIALYAYAEGGATAVGVAVVVRMLPAAIAAPYAALLADRRSRRSVLLASTLTRALVLGAIGVAAVTGAPFAFVLILAALFTVAGVAHKPAQAALLPQLARTPSELAAANVVWSSLDYAAFLVGSLVAGSLAAGVGVDVALALSGAPLVLGGALLLSLPNDARPEPFEAGAATHLELVKGLNAVRADSRIRLLVGLFAADMFVQSIVDVLIVAAALELLDMGEDGVGWLSAAWGLGGLAGGVAAFALLALGRLSDGLLLGCVLAGAPFMLVALWPQPVVALAVLAVVGVGYAIVEVALLTLTQRLAADDVLARVFGVQETLYVVATAAGALVAAALVAVLDVQLTIVVAGLLLPAVAITLRAGLRDLAAEARAPARIFDRLRSVPLFSPLPLATIETLALRADVERYAPGATIIREGEEGDRFYVIDDGAVEVAVDEQFARRQGVGESFGEIALVRDCVRTATVTAVAPVTVLALGRDDFLASLGAHPLSRRAADEVVSARLDAVPKPGA